MSTLKYCKTGLDGCNRGVSMSLQFWARIQGFKQKIYFLIFPPTNPFVTISYLRPKFYIDKVELYMLLVNYSKFYREIWKIQLRNWHFS